MNNKKKGLFISFEGPEASGKSTQLKTFGPFKLPLSPFENASLAFVPPISPTIIVMVLIIHTFMPA